VTDGTLSGADLRPRRMRFAAGLVAGLVLPLLVGEAFLRIEPPESIQIHLGDQSPLSGRYIPDAVLGAGYRALSDYRPTTGLKLAELNPLNSPEPTWLFFGNSFANGLRRAVQAQRPSHRMYYLQERGDRLHLRIAQARLLLESGMRPEQLFFTVIPLEVRNYGRTPLSSVYVNRNGAINYRFRTPGPPWDSLLRHSRLALVAWVSSGLHHSDPLLRNSQISESVPRPVVDDFRRMFEAIGRLSREYQVPATVVVFPHRNQILGNDSKFVMQQTFARLGQEAGIRVFDPSPVLRAHSDRRALFLPDWHHTDFGNGLIATELLAEIGKSAPHARQDLAR
jgi:hypothetical protein